MTEWLYKATRSKATRTETQNLAFLDHFIARSAYELENRSKADNVWDVALGDTVHLYYREKDGALHSLGSYEIASPPAGSTRFGAIVPGTALVRVIDRAFEQRWCGAGAPYAVDPVEGALLGWHVLRRAVSRRRRPISRFFSINRR
jgi:hypothetical protein